ncbi:hypothetical protein BURKHO8Y_20137 [Burkholderia sp. 8Y]|nr:hypothetical protein BURKHO8Y_20137 [Burkholderia sp. 8Y]
MVQTASQSSYPPVIRLLNWLAVLLACIAFIFGCVMPKADSGPPTELMGWHLSVGAAFIALELIHTVSRAIYEPDASAVSHPPAIMLTSLARRSIAFYSLCRSQGGPMLRLGDGSSDCSV